MNIVTVPFGTSSGVVSIRTRITDVPPEAWRAHGYALLKAKKVDDGRYALNRYLELNPGAKDAGVVRYTLAQ